MDPVVLGTVGVVALLVLLLVGVHVGFALLIVGIAGTATIVSFGAAVSTAGSNLYHTFASYELITLPLFVLMGYLASVGGISRRVFQSANDWLGRVRGGLGVSTVVSCTAFGAVCGSSMVTASVFARLCAPEMRRFGYDKNIAYGICAASGMIGMLIPPSILMVVYGVFSGQSIGRLLVAGITPGLLLTGLFSGVIVFLAWWRPDKISRPADATRPGLWRRTVDLLRIWQVWIVAIVIFGGSMGGVFNPTEAAAIACVLMLVILVATKGRLALPLLREAFEETATTTSMIFLVMGGAAVFSHFLVLTGLTDLVARSLETAGFGNLELLALIIVVYSVLGCFLDSISILSITIPLLNPVADRMGWDPIWYAVIVIMTVEMGLITPPVGLNVYAAQAVAERDVGLGDVFVGIMPFLVATIVAIALLVAFPPLSTFLPDLVIPR